MSPMPEFENCTPLPRGTGLGGSELRADVSAILRACEDVGPLFVLFRNEACILGSVADPLWYLHTADVHLAASGAITLNLAPRRAGSAFAYVEPGPRGGFIDAVEFCDARSRGFLKICRMDAADIARWRALRAEFCVAAVPASRIAGIRKTNHLETLAGAGGPPSPAERVLERFLECATLCRASLHVTARTAGGRGRLVIRPEHRARVGLWTVLSAGDTAFHIASGWLKELRVVRRPHLAQLVLFGADGRFSARILTRDRHLLSQLPQIL